MTLTNVTARIKLVADLSQRESASLTELLDNVKYAARGWVVIHEGEQPSSLSLLLDGWALRCKFMANGSRQVLGVILPGDFCNRQIVAPGEMDHMVVSATEVAVATFSRDQLHTLLRSSQGLAQSFWRFSSVDEAIQRAWLTSLGRRDARARIAHLFCELYVRLQWIGLATEGRYRFPLTQEDVADISGLTPVHVNRMLKGLRHDGLISLHKGNLTIFDFPGLSRLAEFNPSYLQNPLNEQIPS